MKTTFARGAFCFVTGGGTGLGNVSAGTLTICSCTGTVRGTA
jgi:hypothetical protein